MRKVNHYWNQRRSEVFKAAAHIVRVYGTTRHEALQDAWEEELQKGKPRFCVRWNVEISTGLDTDILWFDTLDAAQSKLSELDAKFPAGSTENGTLELCYNDEAAKMISINNL